MIQIKKKWQKTSFWARFRPIGPKIRPPIFFFFFSKIWLCQSLDIMAHYHHVKYQKKIIIQSSENLVTDRQMDTQMTKFNDGWMDRHMDRWLRVISWGAVLLMLSIQQWYLLCKVDTISIHTLHLVRLKKLFFSTFCHISLH